jgi:Holliday junction DNA helicase RuvA
MIARLTGKVLDKEAKALLLDVGGVGYRVFVVKEVREKSATNSPLTLFIYHHVSESEETLYGFFTQEHLDYFELLLKVPTVGPRTAMNILEVASPATLAQAVGSSDTTLLTKVSGVGKKTAQRIIVELKGKMPTLGVQGASGALQDEVMEALVSLGYSKAQARQAVGKLPAGIKSVEAALRWVLQAQGKKRGAANGS